MVVIFSFLFSRLSAWTNVTLLFNSHFFTYSVSRSAAYFISSFYSSLLFLSALIFTNCFLSVLILRTFHSSDIFTLLLFRLHFLFLHPARRSISSHPVSSVSLTLGISYSADFYSGKLLIVRLEFSFLRYSRYSSSQFFLCLFSSLCSTHFLFSFFLLICS